MNFDILWTAIGVGGPLLLLLAETWARSIRAERRLNHITRISVIDVLQTLGPLQIDQLIRLIEARHLGLSVSEIHKEILTLLQTKVVVWVSSSRVALNACREARVSRSA